MELNIKIDENTYLDILKGEIKGAARNAIPVAAAVHTGKVKPVVRYKTKVGGVWLGGNKLSFALILAYAMLNSKPGISRAIGFFKHKDVYIYIEGILDIHNNISVKYGYTNPKESPDVFLSVEGKVYDAIFGDRSVRNTDFDFLRIYKRFIQKISIAQMLVIIICLAASGYMIKQLVLPMRISVPIMRGQPPPPPPLSEREADRLAMVVKEEFLKHYTEVVDGVIASHGDKWLQNLQFKTTLSPQNVEGDTVFTYASFYPFSGSKKQGNGYEMTESYSNKLARQDMSRYIPPDVEPYVCLKYLIHYDVTGRVGDSWTVIIREKDYGRILFVLNLLQRCPCVIRDMTVDKGGMDATVAIKAPLISNE